MASKKPIPIPRSSESQEFTIDFNNVLNKKWQNVANLDSLIIDNCPNLNNVQTLINSNKFYRQLTKLPEGIKLNFKINEQLDEKSFDEVNLNELEKLKLVVVFESRNGGILLWKLKKEKMAKFLKLKLLQPNVKETFDFLADFIAHYVKNKNYGRANLSLG